MPFTEELRRAFAQFQSMLIEDHSEELLNMSYAEFTLKCYVGYSQQIYDTILAENTPLAKVFCTIGVEQPRDQLVLFLDALYLHLRTQVRALS